MARALQRVSGRSAAPLAIDPLQRGAGNLPRSASGAAAEMNNGLAWVIIGGLISSLFLTLVIVPVVYSILESIVNRFNKNKEEVNYQEEMIADYIPAEVSEDGFTSKHV